MSRKLRESEEDRAELAGRLAQSQRHLTAARQRVRIDEEAWASSSAVTATELLRCVLYCTVRKKQ